ncbi:hypothetical protein DFH07DRAFT_773831 [Mycena maculata]|uniref:Uncharacterized protein n=1 Tax=Mycena maculata TaxID=230809 RepID=A0AAD7J1W2_9AGAR|nr:hypothetical protein DFH07DRAFT_773831 [Mycena maculata]
MVAVVNEQGTETFAAFQSAAEAAGLPGSTSSPSALQPSSGSTSVKSSPSTPSQTVTSVSQSTSGSVQISLSATQLPGKPIPPAAIAGAVVGVLVVILLCVASVLVMLRRRRRRTQGGSHKNAPRPLICAEPALLELADENGPDTQPEPLILYEKGASLPTSSSSRASRSALPTATELALAEEVFQLRNQLQRIELERLYSETGTLSDRPTEYATR